MAMSFRSTVPAITAALLVLPLVAALADSPPAAREGVPSEAPSDSIPAAIAAPDGLEARLRLTAQGVQIYECQEAQTGHFEWKFLAPEADLADAGGQTVVRHGAGPTWEATDGAKITGKVLARSAAPDGTSIPWLLLQATVVREGPSFAGVSHVQRIRTEGGAAPAQACGASTLKAVARIPYKAVYRFLGRPAGH